jgi:hypothetical protein
VGDGQKVVPRFRPYTLGGGIGGNQIRECLLQASQPTKETVVFAVGYLRQVLNVIEIVVPLDPSPKGLSLCFGLIPGEGLGWGVEVQSFLGHRRLLGASGTTDQTIKGNPVE